MLTFRGFCVCLSCSKLGDVTDIITIAPGQETTVQQLLKGKCAPCRQHWLVPSVQAMHWPA